MIKNYVEIFISGSRNIELLILTMKTKYFCSAVVLEGFEIRFPVATIFYSLNSISTGLFCLVVALGGGGGVFHPPSITPLSLKLDCSNFVRRYFQIG